MEDHQDHERSYCGRNFQNETTWIDTWHMGDKVMALTGNANNVGDLALHGSYVEGVCPKWGWRIVVTPTRGQELHVVMFNIEPNGNETLAVESHYALD
jgi:hypothetical protein